jgi:hypothetical protein
MRVEITVVSVEITFMGVKNTMRVEITLDRIVIILVSVKFTRTRVNISLECVETTPFM